MITLKAPAKINLGLSILGKLPNGYHSVKTIYCQINIFDTIKLEPTLNNQIKIICDDKTIPTDENNLCYKAADLIKEKYKIKKGIKIYLNKVIPVGAGLGGGSADAASLIKGLNKLWQLNLSKESLTKLALDIGADVAYQLVGGIKLETQGGKKAGKFTNLGKLPPFFLVICYPQIKISSNIAYTQVDYRKIGKNNLLLLIKAIKDKDLRLIAGNLHNDFELWTLKKYPEIQEIKNKMIEYGALGSLMSGKGSAVFGIFDSINKAKKTYQFLYKEYKQTFLVRPI